LQRLARLNAAELAAAGVKRESQPQVLHGEDDQIVPVHDSARKSARLIEGAKDIYYPSAPHGLTATHQDQVNADQLFTALKESLSDQRGNAEECLRRAATLLEAAELETSRPRIGVRQGLAPWHVRRVISYIEANLDTRIKNSDLAAVARLSVFHFNVAFRKSVGDSPHGYIIRRRMERAQGLMLSTDASLSEIAATCGLADQAHFTRLFRRIVGESPGAWRRARANPP
jgi:AraC-like DNA-binding protein